MTTPEFLDIRVRELRDFFQARLGRSWLAKLRRASRVPFGHAFFQTRTRPSLEQVEKLEAYAVGLGWKPQPFERKSFTRMLKVVDRLNTQASLSGFGCINLTRLCAITYHKKRARLLRDDVLSEEWRNSWCQEQRTSNPLLSEPAPEKAPKRFALDLLLAEEAQQAKPSAVAASPVTAPAQPVAGHQHPDGSNPPGGRDAGRVSLSAPRAFKNLSREDLHALVNKALDQLKDGDRDTLPPKLHVLSCIARRIEGILRSHETPEDAG